MSIHTIPVDTVELPEVLASVSKLHSDVDVAANTEVDGHRLPAFIHDVPLHSPQRLNAVLLIATTVKHMNREQQRRSHQDGGAFLMVKPQATKVADFSWTQNGFSTMITTVHDIPKHIHRRNRPLVGPLQSIKIGRVVQKTMFVSQVVQPLTAPVTIFTMEIKRARKPRSRLPRGQCSCFLASRVIEKCLQRLSIHIWHKDLESLTVPATKRARNQQARCSPRRGSLLRPT